MSSAKINNTTSANAAPAGNGTTSSREIRAKKRTATGEVKDTTTSAAPEKTESALAVKDEEPSGRPKRQKRNASVEVQGITTAKTAQNTKSAAMGEVKDTNMAAVPEETQSTLTTQDEEPTGRSKRQKRNASVEVQDITVTKAAQNTKTAAAGNGKQQPGRAARQRRKASVDVQEVAATEAPEKNTSTTGGKGKTRAASVDVQETTATEASEKAKSAITGRGKKRPASAEISEVAASKAAEKADPAVTGKDKKRAASVEIQEMAATEASDNVKPATNGKGKKRAASVEVQEMAATKASKNAKPTATEKGKTVATQGNGKKRTAGGEVKDDANPTAASRVQSDNLVPAKKPRLIGRGKKPASAAILTFPDGTPLATNQIITPWEELKFEQKTPSKWGGQTTGAIEEQVHQDFERYFDDDAQRERAQAIKEPLLVDGFMQKPFGGAYGESVPGTGYKLPAPKRTSGRGREKYEPLRLSDGWTLFDPNKGFPAQWSNVPPNLHRFARYTPGNARILKYSLKKRGSVACCLTPEMLVGKAVDYTPAGPRLVDAPPHGPEDAAVDTLLTASATAEAAAPPKDRKGKRKAAEMASEPLPAIPEELEEVIPSVERIAAETAIVNSWPETSSSKASKPLHEPRQRSESVAAIEMPAPKRRRQAKPLPEKKEMPARAGKGQRKHFNEVPVKAETPAPEEAEVEVPVPKKRVRVVRKDSAVETAGGEAAEKKKRTRKPSKPKITPAFVVEDSE